MMPDPLEDLSRDRDPPALTAPDVAWLLGFSLGGDNIDPRIPADYTAGATEAFRAGYAAGFDEFLGLNWGSEDSHASDLNAANYVDYSELVECVGAIRARRIGGGP